MEAGIGGQRGNEDVKVFVSSEPAGGSGSVTSILGQPGLGHKPNSLLGSACSPTSVRRWETDVKCIMINLLSTLTLTRQGKVGVSKMRLWRPDFKIWRRLVQPLISVLRLSMGRVTKDYLISVTLFAMHCGRLARRQGSRGLCLHLKTSHVLLMQALPGSKMKPGSREISKVAVSTSRDGLPRLIPKKHRNLIRRGDHDITRLWLTLFGMYRIVWFKSRLNLAGQLAKTISRPGVVITDHLRDSFGTFLAEVFFPLLVKWDSDDILTKADPAQLKPEILPLTTSGSASVRVEGSPNGGDPEKSVITSSFESRHRSARAWIDGKWGESLWDYLAHIGQVNSTLSFWNLIEDEAYHRPVGARPLPVESGRLATKLEPAGKVRVFAIVDYWTQCCLKPLHDYLFKVLRMIPQDGTFDQLKPIGALLARVPEGMEVSSFDLSAATDRFPVLLQEIMIGVLFGWEYGYHWRVLLTGRSYKAPLKGSVKLKYAVGQPMGALSSWAAFSLTHHALVQFAAYQAGHRGWYPLYALLGDDVVIAGSNVAAKYKALCGHLGVEIGLAKSMVSDQRSCEFAKVVFLRGSACLAFPWKLWGVAQTSLGAAIAAVQRSCQSGVVLNAAQVALAFGARQKMTAKVGAKWENISSRLRALLVILSHPATRTSLSRPTWIDWLAIRGPLLSVQFPPSMHIRIAGWAQALVTEFITPIRERVEAMTGDLLFGTSEEISSGTLPSPAERVLDAKVNKTILEFEDSADKAEASLKHLQKLDIKLRADQASHVFTQVVSRIESQAARIARFRSALGIASDSSERIKLPFSSIYQLWERWRVRAMKAGALASKGVATQ